MKKTWKLFQQSPRGLLLVFSAGALWLGPLVTTVNADDPLSLRKARRRITPLCSVPHADYQYGSRSPSIVVRSLPALEQLAVGDVGSMLDVMRAAQADLQVVDNLPQFTAEQRAAILRMRQMEAEQAIQEALKPRAKLVQLATSELTIAHCRISDVALQFERTGIWHLSLRGDQNYLRPGQPRERNQDLQLKRNAFKLNIRLLQTSRNVEELVTSTVTSEPNFDQTGKLAFCELNVPEFWVQREAPQFITRTGYCEMIAAHFDDIDQAEFEFFIKLDPLTGSGQGVNAPWQREP